MTRSGDANLALGWNMRRRCHRSGVGRLSHFSVAVEGSGRGRAVSGRASEPIVGQKQI